MQPRNPKESGIALIIAVIMMAILSLTIVGVYFMVVGEEKTAISARDNTTAFYAAEGGLEQLSAGLAQLFTTTASPSAAQINALAVPSFIPSGITYSTFSIGCPTAPCTGALPSAPQVIPGTSAFAGLQGVITPFTLTVVADGVASTEAKLVRQVQEVAVPVFEFGIFSATDLSFFAGPPLNFGGRAYTNGNLFLAEASGANTLTLASSATAFKDIIRSQLANGYATAVDYAGTVFATVTTGGCPGTVATCRPLATTEGSLTGGPGSAVNPNWHALSLSTYNGNLRSGSTGAKQLNLAIALAGAQPIDLLRRDLSTDTPGVAVERFMNKASLRILLSDTAAALPGNGTNDANGNPAVIPLDTTLNASLPLSGGAPALFPAATGATGAASKYGYKIDACHPPIALSPGSAVDGNNYNKNYWDTDFTTPEYTPLIGGFIEIDMQPDANPGTWVPVTMEILYQGIEHPFPKSAVDPADGWETGAEPTQTGVCTTGGITYYPIIHLEQINRLTCTGNTTQCYRVNSPAGIPAAWQAGHVYAAGNYILDSNNNVEYVTAVAGNDKSGAAAPAWTVTRNNTTADNNVTWRMIGTNGLQGSTNPWDYVPLNMYDTREGSKRDVADGNIYLNGVMNYAELDVSNLRRWFACSGITTPVGICSGTLVMGAGPGGTNEIGGYIVYFSDRRGNYKAGANNTASNPPLVNNETAEFGNEDTVNAASAAGTPDGVLEGNNYLGFSPEDVDQNGVLDTYGATPDPNIVSPTAGTGGGWGGGVGGTGACIESAPLGCTSAAVNPFTTVTASVAQKNGVIFFRRSLRLYHGSLGQLPPLGASNCTYASGTDGFGGFTVVAENPAYIAGDYNADSTQGANIFNDAAGECHVPSAVIADAVTVLSNAWNDNDANAFNNPTNSGGRNATSSSYRTAIIAGKNPSFALPTAYATKDFGTDGGVHNFVRYMENWGGQNYSYRGSLVSFFYAVQATGLYKDYGAGAVYSPPNRLENFDLDFTSISTLPPGTPRFSDVNALSFEQPLLPYQ
jgi:PilX N-terminal